MTFVTIHYSFDPEVELYVFENDEKAKRFIRDDFDDEMRQENETDPNRVFGNKTECDPENGFACIETDDGDLMEWQIATLKTRLNNPIFF